MMIPLQLRSQLIFCHHDLRLVHFHILENCPHKLIPCPMPQSTTKGTQRKTNEQHVAKVKGCLHQTMHASLEDKVVDGVQEDI